VTPDIFETHRRFLAGLAYRMLGSLSDAEDIVQDAWLRWREAARETIADPRAYLARVVTRLCLDQMKSARSRRELYVGAWLPEPLIQEFGASPADSDALDVPMALLLALERLSPLERAAFLLHDIVELGFDEIAGILGRSEAACRQLASRARKQVRIDETRHPIAPDEAQRYAQAFFKATHDGDTASLSALLARDARLHSDGGGKVQAVLNPLVGADRITRFFAGIARKVAALGQTTELFLPVRVNGLPGYVSLIRGDTLQVTALDIRDGHIAAVYVIRNPDKLRHVASPAGAPAR
jgi:RNA polymerase sigma-70 factor (ECF subfamily)